MQISRGPVIASAIFAVIFVALNILLTIFTANKLYEAADWVSHTHRVINQTDDIVTLLTAAESGMRGYVITGDENYLSNLDDLPSKLNGSRSSLNSLSNISAVTEEFADRLIKTVNDNPFQLERAEELHQRALARAEQYNGLRQAFEEGGFDQAKSRLQTGDIAKLMDDFRDLAQEIGQEEQRLLGERQSTLEGTYRFTILSAIASGIAVLSAIGLYILMVKQQKNHIFNQAETIRSNSELMNFTFQSIGDGVITTDPKGVVTNINTVATQLTGWKRDEAIGSDLTKVFNIVNETTRKPVDNPALKALETGEVVGLANHTVLIRPDGSESPIDDSAAPIKSEKGISGSVLVFRDVSTRRLFERKLMESEATFRSMFDSAPIGIVNTTMNGEIERVNSRFCEIINKTPEMLIGTSLLDLTHNEDRALCQSITAPLFSSEVDSCTLNVRYLNGNGEVVWVNVLSRLIRAFDGAPSSTISAITDISEQRIAEEIRIRMSAIVNASNDAIITKDLNGIVKSWNPAAARLFGYSDAEMIGTPIFKIIPEDKHKEEIDLLHRTGNREEVDPLRTERIRHDGSRVEVLLRVAPLIDADGTLLGVSTIAKDLTAESRAAMELRESERRFRLLADNMSQFAWMSHPDGNIYWFNKRWHDYTGMTLEESRGMGWVSAHHPAHIDRVRARAKFSWETGEPFEETFPIRGKDGEYRWFLTHALPIHDSNGNITQWFGSHTDITELIENEVKLENARRTAELATKARGEFLANMSHEIRTPMTAILGHTEILADHIHNPDDIQSVDTIRRNGKFLLQIINDILDLSKIDAGRIEIERCSIAPAELLHEIRSLLDVRAAEKRLMLDVKLDGSIPYSIQTDPVRLRQILVNLVGNAIKFTDKGRVELICKYDSDNNQMLFRVADTGIGIDQRDLPKLFQPFVQADSSSTREFEGTGLGLAISKRLAEMLGGTITVSSKIGEGSSFSLQIDCGSIGDEPWVREIQPIMPAAKPTRIAKIDGLVMVVDDRRDIRFLAQNFLEKAGARVILATNGREAMEMLQSQQFSETTPVDAVLMDMQMPVMDGYTAAKKLRESGFKKPIIALTANAMKDDRDKCLASGCDDYATKPLDGSTLVHIVATHLQNARTASNDIASSI